MTDEPREALRRIEQRLSQASDAAERLIAEAGRKRPPPAGWQTRADEPRRDETANELFELLHAGARLLDEFVPPEVLARLAAALRELLLAVRALLDFYAKRLGRPGADDEERVRDIPIE
jgi:hypothetical protein